MQILSSLHFIFKNQLNVRHRRHRRWHVDVVGDVDADDYQKVFFMVIFEFLVEDLAHMCFYRRTKPIFDFSSISAPPPVA